MSDKEDEVVQPEVLPPDGTGELVHTTEPSDRLSKIRSLLPSLPPSATEFFLSLWIARREVKAREAAAAVVQAERELLGEYILYEQALLRASDLPHILAADSARRRQESAEAQLAALQAEARLEAFKASHKADGESTAKGEPRQKRTRLDILKHRLFEEARTTVELQAAAEEEIGRIRHKIERGEIAKDFGERLIENIRDKLQKLLEEL